MFQRYCSMILSICILDVYIVGQEGTRSAVVGFSYIIKSSQKNFHCHENIKSVVEVPPLRLDCARTSSASMLLRVHQFLYVL